MSNYWTQRAIDSIGRMEKAVNGQIPDLVKSFEQAKKDLNDKVFYFYARYAANNKITLDEAQKALSLSELRDFRGDLKEFERLAKDSIGTFNLQVDNLSVKARVTRYEALLTQCDAVLQKLYQEQKKQIEGTATDVYTSEYYHRLFDIEKYTGFKFKYSQLADSAIKKVIEQPVYGMDISEHLWRQDIDTGFRIRQALNNMFVTGRPPQDFSDKLQKAIGAVHVDKEGKVTGTGKKYEAYRLLYNESSHATGQANLQAYKDDGIDEYEIVAALDKATCAMCGDLDGKHYPRSEAVEGENYPPFHVNCRCVTAPYINDTAGISSTRVSRDSVTGKSVPTTAKTYDEWKVQQDEKYGTGVVDIERKKAKNESSDFAQYQKYKAVLKENSSKSFANFQNLKYNKSEEYRLTKYDYYLRNKLLNQPELALKHADKLDIDERKYTGYLFNPDNPRGYAKGKAITSRLGYDINNYSELDKIVKANIGKYPASMKEKTQHGQKYEVNMVVQGLNEKSAKLQVGIIYDTGSDIPRLTSMYLDELKDGDFKND